MLQQQKKNLVILRAGKNSLHQHWLSAPYSERNYDTIISYFDEAAYEAHRVEEGVKAFYFKGGKWDGIFHTVAAHQDVLTRYNFVWLPDDDIECQNADVNKIFEVMVEESLAVAQPSLTHNSYFSYFLLLHCPGFKLRYTNFVEVMVPCLHIDVFNSILPHLEHSMSGFGLDYLWCRIPGVGKYRAAIIDAVQVRHTRPVGKILLSAMKQAGRSPKDEERALCDAYGIAMSPTAIAYAGLKTDGSKVVGKATMGLSMGRHYLRALLQTSASKRSFGLAKIFQILRRQLTRPYDTSIAPKAPGNKG